MAQRHTTHRSHSGSTVPGPVCHPDFDTSHIDHKLPECLMNTVEDWDVEVINLWEEGGRIQGVKVQLNCQKATGLLTV